VSLFAAGHCEAPKKWIFPFTILKLIFIA